MNNKNQNKEYIIFSLNTEFYCMRINELEKIIPKGDIRKVPNAPSYIEGVIDVDEQIVPIINIKKRMQLSFSRADNEHIILYSFNNNLVGLLVDEIFEMVEISEEPKTEFTFIPENVHIFSDGTFRMSDEPFVKNKEELIILLNGQKIYSVIEREMMIKHGN